MRDAETKGGSLSSGTSMKEKITGQPSKADIMKQHPCKETDRPAERGHKLRSNTKGY